MYLDIDEFASIISETPTTTFEMDSAIMLHRRYQEAYPSLYRRMVNTDLRSSIVSSDSESENSIDTTSMVVPSDLVRLSIDVGPKFSVALGAMSLDPITPKIGIEATDEQVLQSGVCPQPNTARKRSESILTKVKADRHLVEPTFHIADPSKDLDAELIYILSDISALINEIDNGLIKHAVIPIPRNKLLEQDIFYPAYILSLTLSEMWNIGIVKQSETLMENFMNSIQFKVFTYDNVLVPGMFWLTNVHEIFSFIFLVEDLYEEQKFADPEFARLLVVAAHDLESLEFNIYHEIIRALKKKL